MDSTSKPWREVLPFTDAEFPGVFLAGARYRESLPQASLAKTTGIPLRQLSKMERGRRPISSDNAGLLAEVLQIDPRRLVTD